MALTGSETFGTVVPGFVTDLGGNLAVAVAGTSTDIVPGFLTDADGRLVVTTDTDGAQAGGGFIRNADGALVVAETGSPVSGVLPGFLSTSEGYLAMVNAPSSPTLDGGFYRTSAGLAVNGLNTSGYEEGFEGGTLAGWTDSAGNLTTFTNTGFRTHTGVKALGATVTDKAAGAVVSSSTFPLAPGPVSVSAWVYAMVAYGGVQVAIGYSDVTDSDLGVDYSGAFISGLSAWSEANMNVTAPAGTVKARIAVIYFGGGAASAPELYIDDVLVTQ